MSVADGGVFADRKAEDNAETQRGQRGAEKK
jgi:hypothetical protein